MIYVVDHQDSFTYNLVHLLSNFDTVYVSSHSNINYLKIRKSKLIVLSPGPGEPKNYPETSILYKQYKGKKKILGICLGFQQILYAEGAKIIRQKKIYHGFQSQIHVISRNSIFKNNLKFKVGRYHSLKLKEPFYAENFDITMRCVISGSAMSFENKIDKIYGFQFHPESFLTINGNLLIKKIISA